MDAFSIWDPTAKASMISITLKFNSSSGTALSTSSSHAVSCESSFLSASTDGSVECHVGSVAGLGLPAGGSRESVAAVAASDIPSTSDAVSGTVQCLGTEPLSLL